MVDLSEDTRILCFAPELLAALKHPIGQDAESSGLSKSDWRPSKGVPHAFKHPYVGEDESWVL